MEQTNMPGTASPALIENERLMFALNAAGIGTWDLDPIKNIVKWDERCRELFGFAAGEQVTYEQVLKYMHHDDAAVVHQAVQKALDPANEGAYEVRYRTLGAVDGRLRWVLSKGKAYFNNDGVAYRFAGTAQDVTDFVRESEKVALSESIAQVALENSNSGYFQLLLDTNELDYSPGYAKVLTGNAEKNLTRNDFLKHVHPDDMPVRNQAHKDAATTGRLDYEARTLWNDGTTHWMRAKGTYLNNAAGKPYILTGTVYETTAEHRQLETMKEAEELLQTAFNSASVGMAFTDLQGRFLRINDTYSRLLGYTEEELLTENYLQITHPDDKENNDRLFSELVTGKRSFFNLIKRYIHKSGAPKWVQMNVTRISGGAGKEDRTMAIARDISADVENDKALAASQSMFRNVANSSPTGLWLSDTEGGLTYLNKTLADWTGMAYADLLGAGWANAIIDEDRQRSAEIFLKAVAERAHYDVQFRIKKGNGDVVWCRAAGDPFYDEAGAYAGYAGFCMDIDELVSGQDALQENEARFRSLVQEAPVATCLFVGREMKVEIANNIMIGYWGKDTSVLGQPLAQAVPELVGQPFLDILDDVFTTGKTYEAKAMPWQLIVNGVLSTYYFDFTYKPLRNAGGEVYGIMDMAVDVTEQVLDRKKLEESELFSRDIFNHSPVAKLVFTGSDMIIRTINRNMLEMLGRDNSVIGLPFMRAIPELLNTPLMDRLKEVFTTGVTYRQPEEKLDLVKNGIPYTGYYNYIYKALRDTAGDIYGIMVTATEVTEQTLARQKVEEAQATLRGAVELAELGTWSIDLATGILDYSDRLKEWFGIADDEVINIERAYSVIREEDRPLVREAILHALAPGTDGVYDVEYYVKAAPGVKERILHAQGKAFYDEAGKASKLTGTVQDVTAQRRVQLALEQEVQQRTEELEVLNEEMQSVNEELTATNEELNESNEHLVHSNEELAQYAYVASHDLQEPLRKIRMFSDMLTRKANMPAENKELVEKIGYSAERMSLLINNLLDFSRLLKSDTLMRPVDLTTVMNDVANDFELAIAEKNAHVHVGKLPAIEAVSLQMNQLFYNLLSNALKFVRPGIVPVIEVDGRAITLNEAARYIPKPFEYANYYHITFADNGIGFEIQYAEQIFEVFKRLHGRDIYPGSGIGLALCRRIVANHNGHLYVESEVNKGTTFHIILPDKSNNYQSVISEGDSKF